MLQRATFEPVDRGTLALCYDCPPHDRGMSTFRRLGMAANATMVRHAKLLRTNRKLAGRLGDGVIARGLAPVGNAVLWLRDRAGYRPSGLVIERHAGVFGDEFSELDRHVGARGTIRGRRSAEDLNWRYREDPLHEYVTLTARRREALTGFALLTVRGADAILVDLFGDFLPGDALGLLDAAAHVAREGGAETLHASVSDGSCLSGELRRAGFRRREAGPHVVGYGAAPDSDRPGHDPAGRWNLTHSDIMA
jgi:hypothetical protein